MMNCKKTIVKKNGYKYCIFRSFRFLRQNEAFSATEQNQTYNHSFLEDLVQFSSISSAKASSASTAN